MGKIGLEVDVNRNKREKTAFLKKDKVVDNLSFIVLCLPAVLLIFIFNYLPMVGVTIAFQNFSVDKGIFGSAWVGFKNFEFFFMSQDAWRITRNTLGLNALAISTGLFIQISFALMLFEVKKRNLIKTYQTILILPSFLSWVVVGYMTYALLSPQVGIINKLLESFGAKEISWYTRPEFWPFILTLVSNWKFSGMSCIIYYAALIGIDKEYYEAASIDGANKFQAIKYISIPFLIPIVTIMTLLSIGNIFRADFGMFYNVTRDSGFIYSTTDVIDTYIFRALRDVGDMGMGSAVGLFQSFVGFVLIIITNYIVRKIEPENALF